MASVRKTAEQLIDLGVSELTSHDPRSRLKKSVCPTLSFHIILALAARDSHGYGLMKEVRERTDGAVNHAAGTVYLALQRLENVGLVGDGGLEKPEEGGVK